MSSDQMPEFDFYKTLEVDPEASAETIEAAHRSLVRRYHPDVLGNKTEALERTKHLNIARDWLTNPTKRAVYDRSLRSQREPTSPPSPRPTAQPASSSAGAAGEYGGGRGRASSSYGGKPPRSSASDSPPGRASGSGSARPNPSPVPTPRPAASTLSQPAPAGLRRPDHRGWAVVLGLAAFVVLLAVIARQPAQGGAPSSSIVAIADPAPAASPTQLPSTPVPTLADPATTRPTPIPHPTATPRPAPVYEANLTLSGDIKGHEHIPLEPGACTFTHDVGQSTNYIELLTIEGSTGPDYWNLDVTQSVRSFVAVDLFTINSNGGYYEWYSNLNSGYVTNTSSHSLKMDVRFGSLRVTGTINCPPGP
jgi:curved DNA-binding protein CbpA